MTAPLGFCGASVTCLRRFRRREGEVIYDTRREVGKGPVCKRRHSRDSGCFKVEHAPPGPVPGRTEEGLIYEEFSVEEYEAVRESCTGHGGTGRILIARCGSTLRG